MFESWCFRNYIFLLGLWGNRLVIQILNGLQGQIIWQIGQFKRVTQVINMSMRLKIGRIRIDNFLTHFIKRLIWHYLFIRFFASWPNMNPTLHDSLPPYSKKNSGVLVPFLEDKIQVTFQMSFPLRYLHKKKFIFLIPKVANIQKEIQRGFNKFQINRVSFLGYSSYFSHQELCPWHY